MAASAQHRHDDPHPHARLRRAEVAVETRALLDLPLRLGADPPREGRAEDPGDRDAAERREQQRHDRDDAQHQRGGRTLMVLGPGVRRAVGRRPTGLEPVRRTGWRAVRHPAHGRRRRGRGRDIARPGRLRGRSRGRDERVVVRVLAIGLVRERRGLLGVAHADMIAGAQPLPASQASTPVEQPRAHVVRRRRGPHRHPRQLGELLVGEVVRGAHGGVLPEQAGAEEQRVVRRRGRRSRRPRGGWAAAPTRGRSRPRARRC